MTVDSTGNMGPPSNVNPSMNSMSSILGVLLMNVPDHNTYLQGIDATVANAEQVLEGTSFRPIPIMNRFIDKMIELSVLNYASFPLHAN